MMRFVAVVVILVALVLPGLVVAHEGHEHKVMGVVTAVQGSQVEIESKDGKKVSVVLEKETKFFRGKTVATAAELKVGERAAIFCVEKQGQNLAREVLLGVGEKSAGKTK